MLVNLILKHEKNNWLIKLSIEPKKISKKDKQIHHLFYVKQYNKPIFSREKNEFFTICSNSSKFIIVCSIVLKF